MISTSTSATTTTVATTEHANDILGLGRKRLAFEICEDSDQDQDLPVTKKQITNDHGLVTPPSSPVKLHFKSSSGSLSSPGTSSSTYSRTKAVLQRCSKISHIGFEACLPTRRTQFNQIMQFLTHSIDSGHGDSLYVTGPPGTGKTAQVDLIMREKFLTLVLDQPHLKHDAGLLNASFFQTGKSTYQSVAVISINCIAIYNAESIFAKIHQSFAKQPSQTVRNADDLQQFMKSHPNTTFVVILDEMDKLVTSNLQDTNATKHIFDLFLMAKLPFLRFVLIGIANSLDMKDRFLSRLNLRQELVPQTVSFAPYTAEQMSEIVMEKLKTLDVEPIIQPIAIKFAAKKCSGNTGDLRKLFDILRSSVEVVELESFKLKKPTNLKCSVAKVTLAHVAKVFSTLHNNFSTKSRICKLNMQQRLVLCSLVHRERSDIFQTQTSLDEAYEYYTRLLRQKDTISPLERSEFLEICNALETCGVVNIVQGKSSGKTRHIVRLIRSNVDKKEFSDEISKMPSLKSYL
ncbi:LAME_0G03510g1_1 [Lachancea meyersii CBS 8951]|uniref:Cell division control protein n=1 Tax=Lachancea meyersii CBS 8951 TaxID=1266667 RepID=A0A1G4K6P2_9SACH|nr:LAME_0G03510g1_1 [Lachancea meyersii CBS 8951]